MGSSSPRAARAYRRARAAAKAGPARSSLRQGGDTLPRKSARYATASPSGRLSMKVRWCGLALASLCVAPSANATVNLTGVSLRVGDHPGVVGVVVTFTDGDLRPFDASTLDPSPADGAALLEVAHAGVRAEAAPVAGLGVRAALTQGRNRVHLRLRAAPGRFKYVSYRAFASPERLVVDLWKSAPPVAAATIRSDGCLRLVASRVTPGR